MLHMQTLNNYLISAELSVLINLLVWARAEFVTFNYRCNALLHINHPHNLRILIKQELQLILYSSLFALLLLRSTQILVSMN